MESLFKEIITLYPEEIEISDGVMHSDGGATFSALIKCHDLIEQTVFEISPSHSAMDWSIFQELHKLAKSEFMNQKNHIDPRSLAYKDIVDSFQANYESVLNEYEKSN